MSKKVWIIAVDDRRIGGLVNLARKVGACVEAMVVGSADLAEQISKSGVDKVLCLEVPEGIAAESFAGDVADLARQSDVDLLVSNDGPTARVILGAVSGAIDAAVVGNVQDITVQDGSFVAVRSIANGKAVESIKATGALAAIYIGDDISSEGEAAEIETVHAASDGDVIVGFEQSAGSGLDTARRVVGVGMGVGARENLPVVEAFAEALDAQIACTLPCCDDMKWYPPELVLGSSHHTAAPDIYFAVGISGSPNHVSGVRDAGCIVAINNDENAHMFDYSDYGIVGDLFDVLPALTEALKG